MVIARLHHHLRRSTLRWQSTVSLPSLSISASSEGDLFPVWQASRDSDLISQILINHHNPFHPLESSLQLQGIALTPTLLHQTLLRLHHNSKIALSFFDHVLSLPSTNLVSATTYNLLIDITSKVHQFDLAWQLLVDMDRRGFSPTPLTFSILIRRLIAAGLTRQAIRAFGDMEIFVSAPVDVDSFIFLLDTLGKYGHVKVAVEIFNKRKTWFRPNAKMYNVLIYGWCKIGRIDMAERFLNEMSEKGIDANVVSYNVLLNGICRRARLQPAWKFEKTVRDAENLFEEMHAKGIEPDVTSYSTILHVYSRALKPELTLEKLKQMKEKGISPNVVTYSSAIKCLCSSGRMEEAEVLLDEMSRNGVTPNATTFNCFFKEYRGRKDAKTALSLYKKIKAEGLCTLSLHTYNILLGMFLKMNHVECFDVIWNDLKDSGLGPDQTSYSVVVHHMCQTQKWREACKFFVEMIEKGMLPEKKTFDTLYTGLIQSGLLRTWKRLKKKLNEESSTFESQLHDYHVKPYRR